MQKFAKNIMLLAVGFILFGDFILEARQEGRENPRKVSDLMRAAQTSHNQWLRDLRHKLQSQAASLDEGPSYVSIVPYVTAENGSRSNLGLNNYSHVSFVHGINPAAFVTVFLFDQQGNARRSGSYTVQSNELLQVNDVVNQLPTIILGGDVGTGWLLIYSDEPLTAWASVISNANDDPSIELAIADQIYKPAAFVELRVQEPF